MRARRKTFKRMILLNRRRRSTKEVEEPVENNDAPEEYDTGSTIPVVVAIVGMLVGVALLVKYVL